MAEIASREFMDNLTSLLQAYGPAEVNDDVKGAILESIQAWAIAAEGRPALVYIGEVYKTLQREGRKFPPKPQVASSMFDSSAVCSSCTILFDRNLLTEPAS
jgi:growth factor-regulated tyrosine kinase substrate